MSQDQENRDELDSELFGMGKVADPGEASVEVTKSNRNKFLLFVGVVGVLAVALVLCIGVSVGAYFFLANRKVDPAQEEGAGKKKKLDPLTEQKARIKQIDVGQHAITLVVGLGKVQTFEIGNDTRLLDGDGKRLGGLADLQTHQDAFVTILMTDDRQGLQWLKLQPN
jgi:hypothetical protein